MDFALTSEQSDFVVAIRDFCRRECGTPEQRERLTEGYTEHRSLEYDIAEARGLLSADQCAVASAAA